MANTPMETECDTKTAKYEITFDFAKNLNRIKNPVYSASKTLGNLSWSIMIEPICEGFRRTPTRYKFYLVCVGEADTSSWCYNINAELIAVSQEVNCKNTVKKMRDILYSKDNKWTFHYLMFHCDDIKPKWAFMVSNTITLQAHVTAEYIPQNVNLKPFTLTPMESDSLSNDRRSEVTFDFAVENFSKVSTIIHSPRYMIRNLPWKIRVEPENEKLSDLNSPKCLGFYLYCDGEPGNSTWSCSAKAEIMVVSQKASVQNIVRTLEQVFGPSLSSSWGYRNFMSWNDLLNPECGFIVNDKVIFRAHVVAEEPQGVSWEFTGLQNQPTKSYMNSLLQTLFFTNQLRKDYLQNTNQNDDSRSMVLAMQKVFFELQTKKEAVDIELLTRSLYCEALDLYVLHDIRTFIQSLLEKLGSEMKGSSIEGTIPKLFGGKMKTFIMLNSTKYVNERAEMFYNIQLNVNEKKNINEALREYIPSGLNAAEPNLQNAKKGVMFESFPPVLHVHLMRFHYDPLTDCCVKFNDRFEFYEKLNLNSYLQHPEPVPLNYTLHAVLAHGDYAEDHYVVFINPKCDGKWCKFVDEDVSTCTKKEAIEDNYGGQVTRCTNAYMLVYIRDSELKNVLVNVTEEDIPDELKAKLKEEKKILQPNDSEKRYITMKVFFEKSPEAQPYNVKQSPIRIFRIKSTTTVEQILIMLSKSFNYPLNKVRIQQLNFNLNQAYDCVDFDSNAQKEKAIGTILLNQNIWNIFVKKSP